MEQPSQNNQKKEDNKYLDNRPPANYENKDKNINNKISDKKQNKTEFGADPKKGDKIISMETPYSCISKIQEPYRDISYQQFFPQK